MNHLKDKHGIDISKGDVRRFKDGIGCIVLIDGVFAIESPGSQAIDFDSKEYLIDSHYLGDRHSSHYFRKK